MNIKQLNQEWKSLNESISWTLPECNTKIEKLVERKSKLWDRAVRAGYELGSDGWERRG